MDGHSCCQWVYIRLCILYLICGFVEPQSGKLRRTLYIPFNAVTVLWGSCRDSTALSDSQL